MHAGWAARSVRPQHGANASHGVHVGAADWPVETQRHEGHWGWTAGQILRGHERQPQRGSLPAWLRGLSGEDGDSPPVGVVTLHLGTNDLTKRVLKEGARVSAVARELRGIVRQLCRTLPRALVLLATLIPFCRFPPLLRCSRRAASSSASTTATFAPSVTGHRRRRARGRA